MHLVGQRVRLLLGLRVMRLFCVPARLVRAWLVRALLMGLLSMEVLWRGVLLRGRRGVWRMGGTRLPGGALGRPVHAPSGPSGPVGARAPIVVLTLA